VTESRPSIPEAAALEPFLVDVPEAVLADLRERLRRTRFPDEVPGIGWRHGLPLGYLREIVRYWLDDYDWRAHEARLNRYPQFTTTVDGQRLHFLGLHVNLMNVPPPAGEAPPPTPWRQRVGPAGGGYEAILGTRPQAMGYLLDDSPAGLAAWIIEKFHEWTEGPQERCELSLDLMLTNVMLYWVTRTGASSSRLYWERRQHLDTTLPRGRVTVPTGVANFPGELTRSRRADAERYFTITHWTELPRGGHFPALEVPDLFVGDVRAFFRGLR
jgi:pimeloyl-ACP methyl ester carboxylesterase